MDIKTNVQNVFLDKLQLVIF